MLVWKGKIKLVVLTFEESDGIFMFVVVCFCTDKFRLFISEVLIIFCYQSKYCCLELNFKQIFRL